MLKKVLQHFCTNNSSSLIWITISRQNLSTKKDNRRSTFTSPLPFNSWKQQLADLFRYTAESQPQSQCKQNITQNHLQFWTHKKQHLKGMGYKMLLVLASFHYIMFHNFIQKSPLLHRLSYKDHFGSVSSTLKKWEYYFLSLKKIKMLTKEMQAMSS